MSRCRLSIAIATVVIAALTWRARAAVAACESPHSADDGEIYNTATSITSLSPAGPHMGLRKLVVAEGKTVNVYATSDLSEEGSYSGLFGNVENTPNPVKLFDDAYAVFVAQDNGEVTRLDINPSSGELTHVWTKNFRRGSCASDAVIATPTVHLRDYATQTFRDTYSTDLVYVATRYDDILCTGSRTDNKIYALNAETGVSEWIFNAGAVVDVDYVSEAGWIDIDGDRLYVGTERSYATQNSLWAIDVITGAAAWSSNAGRLRTTPAVRGDRIYVGTMTGEIKALNKSDGSVIWTAYAGGPAAPIQKNLFAEFRPDHADLIGAVDLIGRVWLARDDGTSGTTMWAAFLPGAGVEARSRVAFDPTFGKVYVGDNAGHVHQLNIVDGTWETKREIDAGGKVVGDASFVFEDGNVVMLAGSHGGRLAKYCFPWVEPLTPVAPMWMSASAPLPGLCETAADCGTEDEHCWYWECVSGVCKAAPEPDGMECSDGNDFTSDPDTGKDVCKSGTCTAPSQCEKPDGWKRCACVDRKGVKYPRRLLTKELTGGEGQNEVVSLRATNSCMTLGPGGSRTIVWIHLFDERRQPFNGDNVYVTMQGLGGSGTYPYWWDPVTGDKVPIESVVDSKKYIKQSKRPGTYFAYMWSAESGTPSDLSKPFTIRAHVTMFDPEEDLECINTAVGKVLLETNVRVGSTAAWPFGCGLFGTLDETGTVRIEVTDTGVGVPGAKVVLGPTPLPNVFFRDYENFVLGGLAAGHNYTGTDGKGIALFEDFGNNLNGSTTNPKAATPTQLVQVQCPSGSPTVKTYIDSAYTRVPIDCPDFPPP